MRRSLADRCRAPGRRLCAGGAGSGPAQRGAAVLLAESHLCVHTWPEQRGVTLDVYVCNFGGDHSAKAHALMDALIALFQAQHVVRNTLQRGQLS
jgi:S-adenosylmethionine decarboxylase